MVVMSVEEGVAVVVDSGGDVYGYDVGECGGVDGGVWFESTENGEHVCDLGAESK